MERALRLGAEQSRRALANSVRVTLDDLARRLRALRFDARLKGAAASLVEAAKAAERLVADAEKAGGDALAALGRGDEVRLFRAAAWFGMAVEQARAEIAMGHAFRADRARAKAGRAEKERTGETTMERVVRLYGRTMTTKQLQERWVAEGGKRDTKLPSLLKSFARHGGSVVPWYVEVTQEPPAGPE